MVRGPYLSAAEDRGGHCGGHREHPGKKSEEQGDGAPRTQIIIGVDHEFLPGVSKYEFFRFRKHCLPKGRALPSLAMGAVYRRVDSSGMTKQPDKLTETPERRADQR